MSYICPVCNGLSSFQSTCPSCHHNLDDYGRIDQLWEPYAPYREIDDLKLSNGFDDVKSHECIHIASCPACGKEHLITVKELLQDNLH